ncbi:MAG: adenosylcobinamide-GDP ribazoletransferase [Nocardioidaceae bacterium]
MKDAVRLALGTLTTFPVRPPARVDRRTAAWSMVLAPLVGLLVGLVVVVVLWVLGAGSRLTPSLAAALAVAMTAVLTRGLHLDGLADTADGLGSGRSADQALEVMRKGDVGPFGVATVVLVLVVQVAALQSVLTRDGLDGLLVALLVSRLVLPAVCSRGVPAARPDGVGAVVAGSVSRTQLLVAVVVTALALTTLRLLGSWDGAGAEVVGATGLGLRALLLAVVVPLVAAGVLARHCVHRLNGVTGDVLGACVEVAFATCLVVLALG